MSFLGSGDERLMKTWKPIAAGILSIICGVFLLAWGSGHIIRAELVAGTLTRWQFGIVAIVLGLIAIVGGIFAVRRRVWGLALAGAICAVFPFHPYGDLIWTPIIGILAIAFVALSKNEFSSSTPKPS
jgi:uncharacterized membrane protein HdeD (DUF308 family)